MRSVGFHKEQQQMSRLKIEKIVVQLNNCKIKKSHNSELKDVLKSAAEIGETSKIIDIANADLDDASEDMTLSQIDGRDNFERVSVHCT